MESTAAETLANAGWWSKRTTTQKTLIIGGVLIVIGIGGYLIYKNFSKKEDDDSNQEPSDSKLEEGEQNDNDSQITESAMRTAPTITEYNSTNLPNNGEGCLEVKQSYDREYDYVKCDGVWYVKSKPNSSKNKFPEWKSLEKNKIASERLNKRYPNG